MTTGVDLDHTSFAVHDALAWAGRLRRALGAIPIAGETLPEFRYLLLYVGVKPFIAPDDTHGVVIQLAQSDSVYPGPAELLASSSRDPSLFPSSRGATDPMWWTPVWESAVRTSARLGETQLCSTDLLHTRRLFGEVLGGEVHEHLGGLRFNWPIGAPRVQRGQRPGVTAMTLRGGPPGGIAIGSCRLHQPGYADTPPVQNPAGGAILPPDCGA